MRIVEKWLRIGGRRLLPLFFAGLVIGVFIMNIGKSILLEETGLFDEDILSRMRYMTVDSNALFCYILRKRMLFLIGMAVLATTYLGLAACMAAVLWCGMSAGIFLTALMLRYGLKGLILAMVSVFPQFLFLIPAFLLLLEWSGSLYQTIYFQSRNAGERERFPLAAKLGRLAGIILLLMLGCLLESYLNPALLIGYLRIF